MPEQFTGLLTYSTTGMARPAPKTTSASISMLTDTQFRRRNTKSFERTSGTRRSEKGVDVVADVQFYGVTGAGLSVTAGVEGYYTATKFG